ncbi:hypothetical protein HMPREF3156_02450 [Neisseria sp. HMSC06F02]|nr:hypothetical protein HMPREF3156_02450 [Neisseria sp. HMSC06F02]
MLPRLTVLSVLSAASSPCPDYVNPLYEQISTAQGPAEYARSLDERSSDSLTRSFYPAYTKHTEIERTALNFLSIGSTTRFSIHAHCL